MLVSEKVIDTIINSAKNENKNLVLNLVINSLSQSYDGDNKIKHILDLLIDDNALIEIKNIDIDFIKNNPKVLMWNSDDYEFKDITIINVDNIETKVYVNYKYIEKHKLNLDGAKYKDGSSTINFIDYPEMLKKS